MREILRVSAHQASPALRALFDMDQPLAIRCFAVLDGSIFRQIRTDDLARPTWGVVQEAAFNNLFLGGQPDANQVDGLIERRRQEGRSLSLSGLNTLTTGLFLLLTPSVGGHSMN